MQSLGRYKYRQSLHQFARACDCKPRRPEGPADQADLAEIAATNHDRYVADVDEQIRWQPCEAGRRAVERLGCRKFGRCLECGREISSKRLEEVP